MTTATGSTGDSSPTTGDASTSDVETVQLQTPLVGLDMDADTAHYVGMLEGTVASLVINEVKYRALLELITGENWEGTRIDTKGEVLQQLAISALVKQTGISSARGKTLVTKRWAQFNLSEEIVPVAVPTAQLVSEPEIAESVAAQSNPAMSSRFAAWKARQQQAAAALADADITAATGAADSTSTDAGASS